MRIQRLASASRWLTAGLLITCWLVARMFFYSGITKAQDTTAQKPPSSSPASAQLPKSKNDLDRKVPGRAAETLKVKVNLVEVPVVVRDTSGHAVGDLGKEDFEVFDNHQRQELTRFTVEKAGPRRSMETPEAGKSERFVAPERFTAILFDDVHLTSKNLPQLQAASLHLVSKGLARTERVGVFTTSGKLTLDFTDDGAKLQETLNRLKPNPLPGTQAKDCPDISYYQANQIINRHDLGARGAAVAETLQQCGIKNPKEAEIIVLDVSEQALNLGDFQTRMVLKVLAGVLERVSTLPGQRTVVLASPSFLVSDREHREYEVIDKAVRGHVVICALDARGVATDENEIADSNVLAEFADGTGGTFFHNNNNLEEGVRRVVAAPEYVYQLGFSPKDLKEDGAYHHLKVKIVGKDMLTASVREGYFAPKQVNEPSKAENNEISEALFSQGEIHELPIEMQTQFVQGDKPIARLSVLTLVDLGELPHRQTNNQNDNELRIVAAVFDRNGKYMSAIDKKVAVHWPADKEGVRTAAKYDFILDSGNYLVRLVVRDSESHHLSTRFALVEIPSPGVVPATPTK